jgi:short-subunit dehydrogenase
VFVGSVLVDSGCPASASTARASFGLRGFAESLRRELADTSVGVQYLGPRSTRTALNSDAVTPTTRPRAPSIGRPAGFAARALLALLESGAPERFLGFPEKLAVRLNGLVPAWLDGAFAKHRASLPPLAAPAALALECRPGDQELQADSHSLSHRAS